MSTKHPLLDVFRERFEYSDGQVLVKKSGQWEGKVGDVAGTVWPDGRIRIQVKYQMFFAHNIVWLLFNDDLPQDMTVDHIDRDRTNNRIENLRLASREHQQGNKGLQVNSSSGFKGVSNTRKDLKSKPWRAYIKDAGKSRHLGYYATAEDAARAYDRAATAKFGEYAHLNFPE